MNENEKRLKGLVYQNEFHRKLHALEELFGLEVETLQKILGEIEKKGQVAVEIIVPEITLLGLPVVFSKTAESLSVRAKNPIPSISKF